MRLVTDVLSVGFRSERTPCYGEDQKRKPENESLENRQTHPAEPNVPRNRGKATKVLRPQKIGIEEKQGRDIAMFLITSFFGKTSRPHPWSWSTKRRVRGGHIGG